jgi:hypothetical protein
MIPALATIAATAQAASPSSPHREPRGDELFLWLGVTCFLAVAAFLAGRSAFAAIQRRRRGRALRAFRTEPSPKRHDGLLRRFVRGEPRPRVVRAEGWEARTRRAELKAEQAVAALRTELTPHLARMMKDRLIWTLMTQRARLLSANQANYQKVATLEHRLTAIQLQIRKQADAYEGRIRELESQLSAKSALTRELLKFRVLLARQALDAVRLDKVRDRR